VTPSVLVSDTTRWACAARLAIVLAKTGIKVSAICPAVGHPIMKTRAIQEAFPYSGLRPLDSLRAAIEKANPDSIVPCDDRTVQHLHELHAQALSRGSSGRQIAGLIERSLGSPQSFPIVSARHGALAMFRDEGLLVPEMKLIRTLDDLESWSAAHPLPWVLKADGTWGGKGVRIAHSIETARKFFSELTRASGAFQAAKRLIVNRDPFYLRPWWDASRPAVIAQAYVRGRPANCAVVCWEGRVLAGISAEVVSADGPTGPASHVRIVQDGKMMEAAERIARRLGMSGFFGLDFMKDNTGELHLIEMNPRCTPLCALQLGDGRDMVGALWAQLSGQRPRETQPVTEKDLIAYFPQGWRSNPEDQPSCFYDVPWDEPELVQELLHPWPDRTLRYTLFNRLWALLRHAKATESLLREDPHD